MKRWRGRIAAWEQALRRAPLGVVVLGTILGLLGAGSLLGGIYLALARPDIGWRVWLGVLAIGPLSLYVAVRLVSLAAWTWSTMIVLLVLLLISSCARAWITPEIPTVPIFEILIELATLGYLASPSVRRAFGRA
ncbi:MAG TPA: hypothetical protein VF167_13925 [Longimicrobiaceae bacterium]